MRDHRCLKRSTTEKRPVIGGGGGGGGVAVVSFLFLMCWLNRHRAHYRNSTANMTKNTSNNKLQIKTGIKR
jgi:hypothetical protein